MFRLISPSLIVGALFFSSGIAPLVFLGSVLVQICEFALIILVFICFLEMASARRIRSVFMVGLAVGAHFLGRTIGGGVQGLCHLGVLDPSASVFALLVVFCISMLLIPARRPSILREPTTDTLANGETDTLTARCSAVSSAYKLSTRESEILNLLARGRSKPYIRDVLFLSQNTISTYTKHLYKKLDVHSKQELIDLVVSFDV